MNELGEALQFSIDPYIVIDHVYLINNSPIFQNLKNHWQLLKFVML